MRNSLRSLKSFWPCGFAERAEKCADFLLALLPRLDFLQADYGVFLGTGSEVLKATLIVKPGDALGAGLETQSQRALDSDFVVAEVFIIENLADHPLTLNGLCG